MSMRHLRVKRSLRPALLLAPERPARTLTAEWQCMLFRESPLVLRSRCQLPQTVFRDGRRRNPNRQIRPTARMRFSVRHHSQNALFREVTPRLPR